MSAAADHIPEWHKKLIDAVYLDSVSAETAVPLDRFWDKYIPTRLPSVLETLSPREERVLRLRHEQGLSLRDVGLRIASTNGSRIGLTRSRAQQIQAKALRKMRHPSRLRYLVET